MTELCLHKSFVPMTCGGLRWLFKKLIVIHWHNGGGGKKIGCETYRSIKYFLPAAE